MLNFEHRISNWRTWIRHIGFFLFIGFSLILSFGCEKKERKVTPAFYHWKTNVQLTDFEVNSLDELGVEKLYIKFFDVDYDFNLKDAFPVAEVNFKNGFDKYNIIPTIYITNRTFVELEYSQLPKLAANILSKIDALSKNPYSEIQIDCDWTPSTVEPYFELLRSLKNFKPNIIFSSTIRLHQVKYSDITGVPPVDKGMLMFYNMGNVEDPDCKNSILDLAVAQQYIVNFENYPIPLDVALPLFSWSVLFREGKMIKLITKAEEELKSNPTRFEKINSTHFKVIKSTYLNGHYLYEGDVLRVESTTRKSLINSAKMLKSPIQNENLTVSFYHLDTTIINHFPYDFLEEVCNTFY